MQATKKIVAVNNQEKESAVLKYYHKFEPMAAIYARKIFSANRIGFEYEDVEQEYRIKVYTSIIAYAARWKKYRATGKNKPMNIKYYIQSALVNLTKDFIAKISNSTHASISIEQDGFDYSLLQSIEGHIIINPKVCKCEINGVDLLEGLNEKERRCFMLFLRGYTISKLQKIFRKEFPANQVIRKQISLLQTKKYQLLENNVQKFVNYNIDLEN